MSMEEETELRDIVAQTLEQNGCLPKIRAQLRANLYLALDEDSKFSKQQPLLNNKVKSHLEDPEGQLMFCLVREFLEYFNLDFTMSVFEPESYMGNCYKYEGREKIIEDLGLKTTEDNSGPILLRLIKIVQMRSKLFKIINSTEVKESFDEDNGHSDTSEIEDLQHKNEEECNLHTTFVVKPTVNKICPVVLEPKKDTENDDTFNGTSSIEEEAENGTDNVDVNGLETPDRDSSSETKSKSEDKKSDKVKSKDLAFQLKPRGSDLLPSLYSKGCKDKNKDVDFDFKDDYEEDFMSGSEIDFSVRKPWLEEQQNESPESAFTHSKNDNANTNKSINSGTVSEQVQTSLSVDGDNTNSTKINTNSTKI